MLPGGPASKIGHRYETWWTVYQLLRMLQGETAELRIEVPGIDKAEFVVTTGGTREYHQVKRSSQSGKWSLASLRYDGILRSMYELLIGNEHRFIFVSGSEGRDLFELCSAAWSAESIDEFEHRFVEAEDRKRNFDSLCRCWECDTSKAIEILRRIDLRTIDEHELQEKVGWAISALFTTTDHNNVVSVLRNIVADSVHHTITRKKLVDVLTKGGYQVRKVTPEYADIAIKRATERYLDSVRSRLIQNTLISRETTEQLLLQLNEDVSDYAMTGKAGAGKTACVIELVEGLRKRAQPVMAFRLDRISSTSTTGLGNDIGLDESPVLILAAAAEAAGQPGVLIVDQLDAVSNMSGRSSEAFDLVKRLIDEIRGTRTRVAIHTVVVCRIFDWKNDSLLRGLLSDDHKHFDVTEFEIAQVNESLRKAGFNPDLFQRKQLELLSLPQNLALFLESDFDSSNAPQFDTSTKLFDGYWQKKRSLVEVTNQDQWMPAIEKLCDEMSSTQRLWVRRERLDSISSTYLSQLASEGVLTFDGQRYGFGHESFFDYCFARVFMNRSDSMTSFLKRSEQHLFRRSQIRQILAYCRDADRSRYMHELNDLLSDSEIRIHIKDLVFALLAEVSDPTEQEWAIWEEWAGAPLRAIDGDISPGDDIYGAAWRRLLRAKSWFYVINEHGLIRRWLSSGSDLLADFAVSYLQRHHAHAPDQVAALVEPYTNGGGKWPDRLYSLMRFTRHHTSRADFELMLRLVDNGMLDQAGHEFWVMLYGLDEKRPEWVPEILARYLIRRFTVIRARGDDLYHNKMLGYDPTASKMFLHAAERSPLAFVRHVLPAVLHLSDSSLVEHRPPKRDAVWRTFIKSEHEDGIDTCLSALALALSKLSGRNRHIIIRIIAGLLRRDTYIANYLLQSVYMGAAHSFADESVSVLSDQPWRLQCGFSDSRYWWTMELIRSVIPHCTAHSRKRLVDVILNYVDPFERPSPEFRHNSIGYAAFHLLSVIPRELRSNRANRHFGEWERRFGRPNAEPRGIVGGAVRSPIGETATAAMTDNQWHRAIQKHRENMPERSGSDFLIGGAYQLSQLLEARAKEEPDRFARLTLTLPSDVNPVYIDQVLSALRDATVDTEVKLGVCRKAYDEFRQYCGKSIADVLGNIDDPLPQDALDMLHWLGTEHGDPEKELWRTVAGSGQVYYGGDIYTHGINTARGRAAKAIHRLILSDASYIERFQPTIELMITDRSTAVRSCAAGVLRAVARHDSTLGMSLFQHMNLKEERLLGTIHVVGFVGSHLLHQFPALRPTIVRMLRSFQPEVCKVGAELASTAAMLHEGAVELGEESLRGNQHQRRGVAHVAAVNIGDPRYRAWCEAQLLILFDDDDAEVRRGAAQCFRRSTAETLRTCEDLIKAFCNSAAFAGNELWLFDALEKSTDRLPGITCKVCERSLSEPSMDKYHATKLIFRAYQQHQNDRWASPSLDLIDRLCLSGHWGVESQFEEFDR